jgi:homoserine dehydrogenase
MPKSGPPFRIALFGVGRVGRSFLRLLGAHEPLLKVAAGHRYRVVGLADRRGLVALGEDSDLEQVIRHKETTGALPTNQGVVYSAGQWQQWLEQCRADVLVDCSVSEFERPQPALDLYRCALKDGGAVISANKPPIVHGLKELSILAARHGSLLRYGATVGASLPAWELLHLLSRQETLIGLEVVLNGTTNWIITEMETKGVGYQEALADAQRLGYAEPYPRRDVNGSDTAAKLLILANSFWDSSFSWEDIRIRGIEQLTPEWLMESRAKNRAVKLIGRLAGRPGAWRLSVEPELLELDHPLAGLTGTKKGVCVETATGGRYTLTGGASGPDPTASSMIGELIQILERGSRGDTWQNAGKDASASRNA